MFRRGDILDNLESKPLKAGYVYIYIYTYIYIYIYIYISVGFRGWGRSLNSLKAVIQGSSIGDIKEDTGSLDYSLYTSWYVGMLRLRAELFLDGDCMGLNISNYLRRLSFGEGL